MKVIFLSSNGEMLWKENDGADEKGVTVEQTGTDGTGQIVLEWAMGIQLVNEKHWVNQ